MRQVRGTEAFWPTESQELLLKAALLPGPAAQEAWRQWTATHDFFDHPRVPGSFRLFPLVYKRLAADRVDDPLLPRLKGVYRYWWSSNHRLFGAAAAVLDDLRDAGIRTMVLKGAALCPVYYADVGARPMLDVDVLVHVEQIAPALARLRQSGWRTTTRQLDDVIRFQHSTSLVNDAGRQIDLHWHAFKECLRRDSDDELWNTAVPVQIAQASTLAPDPTMALLLVVVHGIRWNPEPSVRWIPDALAIVARGASTIDWPRLAQQAIQRGISIRLCAGLTYLRDRFAAPIPAETLSTLRSSRPSVMEQFEYRYFSQGPAERRRVFARAERVLAGEPLVGYLRWASGKSVPQALAGLPAFVRHRVRLVAPAARRTIRGWASRGRATPAPG